MEPSHEGGSTFLKLSSSNYTTQPTALRTLHRLALQLLTQLEIVIGISPTR
jgi:hypothetical protein